MSPPPALEHTAGRALPSVAHPVRPLPRRRHARLLERAGDPTWRLLADLLVLYVASAIVLLVSGGSAVSAEDGLLAFLFPPLVTVLLRSWRSPDRHMNASALDTAMHVLGAVSLAAMVAVALDSIGGGQHPVTIALRLWLFALGVLGAVRVSFVFALLHARLNQAIATPTLIVGAGVVGEQVVRRLIERPEYGLCPVGILDADPPQPDADSHRSGVPLLGGPDQLADAARRTGAQRVILAFSAQRDHLLVEVIRRCQELGLEVSLVPRFYEMVNERATLDHLGGLPLLSLSSVNPKGWQFALKHTFDRVVALIALILLAPLLSVVALAVRLSSPGPILFRQRRVGRDGRVFDLLKFRTMVEPAGEENFVPVNGSAPGGVEGVDRRTPIGKWLREASLDELPQLLNVLRGDMSLVGPRPERPEFVDRFSEEVNRYGDRHRVKSGITGWAQVHGLRGQTSIADRVEWDNYYVRNWSPGLDLRILALTLVEIARFREAS